MITYQLRTTIRTKVGEYEERDGVIERAILRERRQDYTDAIEYVRESLEVLGGDSIQVELWMLGHPAWPDGLCIAGVF